MHRLTAVGCNDPRGTKLGHPRALLRCRLHSRIHGDPVFQLRRRSYNRAASEHEGRIFISIFILLVRLLLLTRKLEEKPRVPRTRAKTDRLAPCLSLYFSTENIPLSFSLLRVNIHDECILEMLIGFVLYRRLFLIKNLSSLAVEIFN